MGFSRRLGSRQNRRRVAQFILSSFPEVAASTKGTDGTNATTRNITLPSGSGGKLVVIAAADSTPTISMTDWTKVTQTNQPQGENAIAVFERTADGSDPVAIATDASESVCWICYRITGAGAVSGSSNSANNLSTTGNPASFDAGSVKKRLWIAGLSLDNSGTPSVTSAPDNYGNLTQEDSGFTGGSVVAGAYRQLETDVEDPSAFTHGSETWAAATIAVDPGSL